mmetsp:Transcript_20569/g.43199  ORF Transcript_20569/g.43199 Transcript_20569/m.43199 type:complete len:127 (-) Transcript_20569:291-671(-)
MGAIQETTFAVLLAADLEHALPTEDEEVQASLNAYGVSFKKNKGNAHVAARTDLLAGITWLSTHHSNLESALPAIPDAQQARLAAALNLDFAKFCKHATWLRLIARRVLAQMDPETTPKKRKAPSS